jgi:hypothetical protein
MAAGGCSTSFFPINGAGPRATRPRTHNSPRVRRRRSVAEPAAADYVEGEFVKVTSAGRSRLSPLAVASLTMAACNFIPYVNFGAWLLSLIFGHLALAQMKRDGSLEGRGLAIAGLVITYFVVLMALTFIILMMANGQPLPLLS